MLENLPPYPKVFFVHYQCEDFNEGQHIISLCIFSKGKAKEYSSCDEADDIAKYCQHIKDLCNEGLTPIHWNQNRSYFGVDHITSRYTSLTNKEIELVYVNEINLAELLVELYGDEYVSHPRLDSLAELNQSFGSSRNEYRQRTFSVNRVMLITKIYHRLINNKLVVEDNSLALKEKTKVQLDSNLKLFPEYLIHTKKEELAKAIKNEFSNEKGKSIRILLEAMQLYSPPLITIGSRQGKEIYESLRTFFDRDIGSYQGVIGYKIVPKTDQFDIDNITIHLNNILKRIGKI